MKILRRIRSLPRHTQAHVAFIIAFILSVGIALIWIPTLPARFEETRNTITEVTGETEGKAGFGTIVKEIASSTTKIKEIFKETELSEQGVSTEQESEIYMYQPDLATSSASATSYQSSTTTNNN